MCVRAFVLRPCPVCAIARSVSCQAQLYFMWTLKTPESKSARPVVVENHPRDSRCKRAGYSKRARLLNITTYSGVWGVLIREHMSYTHRRVSTKVKVLMRDTTTNDSVQAAQAGDQGGTSASHRSRSFHAHEGRFASAGRYLFERLRAEQEEEAQQQYQHRATDASHDHPRQHSVVHRRVR